MVVHTPHPAWCCTLHTRHDVAHSTPGKMHHSPRLACCCTLHTRHDVAHSTPGMMLRTTHLASWYACAPKKIIVKKPYVPTYSTYIVTCYILVSQASKPMLPHMASHHLLLASWICSEWEISHHFMATWCMWLENSPHYNNATHVSKLILVGWYPELLYDSAHYVSFYHETPAYFRHL